MGQRWENVTEDMDVNTITTDGGLEMTIIYKDRLKDKNIGLFLIDSEDVFPLSKKQAVHMRAESDRRYAFLLKQASGNLAHLLGESEFRLSVPMCLPGNNFSRFTDIRLERHVEAPDWDEITSQCKPVLVKSSSSNGFYVKLLHRNKLIALLGAYKGGVLMAEGTAGKYKVEAAKGATVSFHAFMKN